MSEAEVVSRLAVLDSFFGWIWFGLLFLFFALPVYAMLRGKPAAPPPDDEA